MSPRIISLVVPLVLVTALQAARAQDPSTGSIAAATCVPTRATLDAATFNTSATGAYGFKSGTTGTMEFTCRLNPLPSPLGIAAHSIVNMHYAHDDDGASNGDYYARLQVHKRRKDTGSVTTVCDVYSTTMSAVASTPDLGCYFFSGDADDYYFYANVTLFRDVTTQPLSILFYGLSYIAQTE